MPAPKKLIYPSETPQGKKLVAFAKRTFGAAVETSHIREVIDAFYGSTKRLPNMLEIFIVYEKLGRMRERREFARSYAEAMQVSRLARAASAERKRKGLRLTKAEIEVADAIAAASHLHQRMPQGQKRPGKYDESVLEHQLAQMTREHTGRSKPVRKGPRRRAWHLP